VRGEGRKRFFLKKMQKLLRFWGARCGTARTKDKSFLVLFFKKDLLACPYRCICIT
jgi:hypothetical protein